MVVVIVVVVVVVVVSVRCEQRTSTESSESFLTRHVLPVLRRWASYVDIFVAIALWDKTRSF